MPLRGAAITAAGLVGWRSSYRARGTCWNALGRAHDTLGFTEAAAGREVLGQLVPARVIEPPATGTCCEC